MLLMKNLLTVQEKLFRNSKITSPVSGGGGFEEDSFTDGDGWFGEESKAWDRGECAVGLGSVVEGVDVADGSWVESEVGCDETSLRNLRRSEGESGRELGDEVTLRNFSDEDSFCGGSGRNVDEGTFTRNESHGRIEPNTDESVGGETGGRIEFVDDGSGWDSWEEGGNGIVFSHQRIAEKREASSEGFFDITNCVGRGNLLSLSLQCTGSDKK
jgi:hypothetical protein